MVFHRILVALDHSPQSYLVFQQALAEASHTHGHMMLVHSVRTSERTPTGALWGFGTIADVDTYGALKQMEQERIQKEIITAQGWLEPYRQEAIAHNISVEVDCRAEEPAVWICQLAQQWQADLIVVGRRGHRGLAEVVLGSVSNYVIHHAPCSVLVVQGDEAKPPIVT